MLSCYTELRPSFSGSSNDSFGSYGRQISSMTPKSSSVSAKKRIGVAPENRPSQKETSIPIINFDPPKLMDCTLRFTGRDATIKGVQ